MLFPGTGGADILGRESLNGGQGDDLYIVEYASWFLDGNYTDTGLTTDQLVNKGPTFRTGNGIGIDELRFTQAVAADIVLGGTNLQGVVQLVEGIERVVIGTGTGDTANRTGTTLINIDASSCWATPPPTSWWAPPSMTCSMVAPATTRWTAALATTPTCSAPPPT
jgi:hypothetical protein